MKAKTIDNSPHGWDTCIYDNEDCPMGYYVDDLPDKERADKYTNIFNLELSSHVAKETEKLQAEIKELKAEVERLKCIGHTPESEMHELSTRELIERLIASQLKVEKLEFMIEHGLGYDDMVNDITIPHEI